MPEGQWGKKKGATLLLLHRTCSITDKHQREQDIINAWVKIKSKNKTKTAVPSN